VRASVAENNHSRKLIFESALWLGHLVTIAAGMAAPIALPSGSVALVTGAEGGSMPAIFDAN